MALDPSIALGVKQPQVESPINRFAQVLAIQNAGNQNALAQYTLGKAKREDETQNALIAGMKGINSATPEGQQQTFKLLMENGKFKEAQEFMSSGIKRRLDEGKITEQDLKAAGDRFDRFSAGLAPLAGSVQRGEPVSHDQVFSVLSGLKSQGLIADEQIRGVPMNALSLPDWIKSTVNQTEVGRKAFEPFLPKPVQAGGRWVNTAPLAGQIGAPIAGAPAIGMTPAEQSVSQNRPFRLDGTANLAVQNYELGKSKAGATNVTVKERQRTFENEDKLRADYSANPMVKASAEMQNAFNMIESAYKRPSPANDLAMATKYMKILDPTSVVRESEYAMAVNATGLLDKVYNYANMIKTGQRLNPTQRKDFYDSAKSINDAFQAERGTVDKQFSDLTEGYGLNPKNVVTSLRTPKAASEQPRSATPSAQDLSKMTDAELKKQLGIK